MRRSYIRLWYIFLTVFKIFSKILKKKYFPCVSGELNNSVLLLVSRLLRRLLMCSYYHYDVILCKKFWIIRTIHPEVFLGNCFLKLCSKFTGDHPCQSVISIKLQSNFNEITLRHGCCPVNLMYIFRTLFLKNTSGRLLRIIQKTIHLSVKHLLFYKTPVVLIYYWLSLND